MIPVPVAAAVKTTDGLIHFLPAPFRHGDIIAKVFAATGQRVTQKMQGFLLSNGAFEDRITAAKWAIASGRIKELRWPPNLYTEDLW